MQLIGIDLKFDYRKNLYIQWHHGMFTKHDNMICQYHWQIKCQQKSIESHKWYFNKGGMSWPFILTYWMLAIVSVIMKDSSLLSKLTLLSKEYGNNLLYHNLFSLQKLSCILLLKARHKNVHKWCPEFTQNETHHPIFQKCTFTLVYPKWHLASKR